MECIIRANPTILGILGKPADTNAPRRITKHCIALPVAEGVLLFHTLTREMLLLDRSEAGAALTSGYLFDHYFTVPEALEERELVELVRWVRSTMARKNRKNRSYTILPTTDCNARCFYCYEKGCTKITMSPETAEKTAAHIIRQSEGNPVQLHWFGGEPMMNYPAIDIICDTLRSAGVSFQSRMTSNGYLFDDALAVRAANDWNLKKVQITLDGTEAVYNRSKAYVDAKESPYQRVLGNIGRLLDAGISVVIRMNMGLHNREDLLALTRQLETRFAGRKGFHVYSSLLFNQYNTHTPAQWEALYQALGRLNDALFSAGLAVSGARRLARDLPIHYCMADSSNSELILPDGRIGLCEHHTDDEFIGHIDSPHREEAVIASWQERFEPLPECAGCAHYPECMELKKCSGRTACFEQSRNYRRWKTEQAMEHEYLLWKAAHDEAADAEPLQDAQFPEFC